MEISIKYNIFVEYHNFLIINFIVFSSTSVNKNSSAKTIRGGTMSQVLKDVSMGESIVDETNMDNLNTPIELGFVHKILTFISV